MVVTAREFEVERDGELQCYGIFRSLLQAWHFLGGRGRRVLTERARRTGSTRMEAGWRA